MEFKKKGAFLSYRIPKLIRSLYIIKVLYILVCSVPLRFEIREIY